MLKETAKILKDFPMPRMAYVKQNFPHTTITDLPAAIRAELEQDKIRSLIKPGMRICITCGSRGVANSDLIAKELVAFVKRCGGEPFIIPAMGSHGGATAEGQRGILRNYGITEESCGCPILASMETVKIGVTEEGHDVFIDKYAAGADGIILNNRIKPHTSFRGPYESGLMKMAVIGLGKQTGAEACHINGYDFMGHLVPLFGKVVLQNAPILFGFGMLENEYEETAKVIALTKDEIITEEPKLLKEAFGIMPRLLLESCDVLIVDEAGKEISGAGMDPNVIGRFFAKGLSGGLQTRQIALLNLTEASHGNFLGTGLADFVTRRVYDKIDLDATYANCLTCLRANSAYLPVILDNDMQAIAGALMFCYGIDRAKARVIRIKNTLQLSEIQVSESLLEEVKLNPMLTLLSEAKEMPFDAEGNLPMAEGGHLRW
ncbi:MAG: lactate racemase domain-containing protein [Candidatus Limiplasma sp.]|nr:lactate racemase domain-containing protein [Candidatus Limiplasma sp.]